MILLMLATTAYSATYYVNGTSGNDGNPGTIGSPWQTIRKANITLVAGDTVYIRGGTSDYQEYSIGALDGPDEGIHPVNSGADVNHRITYSVYPGEKVHFIGNTQYAKAVIIEDKNWIHVTGHDGCTSAQNFKFSKFYWFLRIWSASKTGGSGSDYCEIDLCEFTQCYDSASTDYRGSTIYRNSQYNWIHDCTFSKFGFYTESTDGGALFELGNEAATNADNTAYNVIEDCKFYHGGHHTFGLHTMYNVVRNNYMHNEQWWYFSEDGTYRGYRNFYIAGGTGAIYHGYNLIEGNRISHASGNLIPYNLGGGGISLNQSNDIIRYNNFYANGLGGIFIQCGPGEECSYNHIYNNSWLSNGYLGKYDLPYYPESLIRRPVVLWNGSSSGANFPLKMIGNSIKNNLMWKNRHGQDGLDQIVCDVEGGFTGCSGYDTCGNTVILHNWTDIDGDPKFVSEGSYGNPHIHDTGIEANVEWYWPKTPDGSDITTLNTEPNFNLQSSSPAIDGGTYLTQANGSGSNSTILVVDDAKYFQPGWGNGSGGGASVAADSIAIGTVSNTVQISSINYDTKTITLAYPMTWSNDAPVWLYKNSSGQVVLRGSAPDCGAHEYVPSAVQTISLSPGWNWISFNVLPTDLSLNSIFTNILTQVEQVKAQTQSAIRSGGVWKGDLSDMSGIGQYKMFKVKVSAACTLTVTGTAALSATPIQLAGGWNWVAFLPITAMPIATALDSIKGQVQEAKSLTQSATYNGSTWSGTLTQLEPGQGYAIKMNAPGTLTYPGGQ
jgi:hypothetical protein